MLINAIATVPMDVFETVDGLVNDAQATIGGIISLVGLIVGIIIAWKSKSATGAVVGIVVGGLVAGLGGLIMWASGIFNETLTTPPSTEASAVVNEQVSNHPVIDPQGVSDYQL